MDAEVLRVEIGRLEIKPEDTLVVKVDAVLTEEMRHSIRKFVEQRVPLGQKVLVLDKHISLQVLESKHDRQP